jgi:hypothetical protein
VRGDIGWPTPPEIVATGRFAKAAGNTEHLPRVLHGESHLKDRDHAYKAADIGGVR